jgi:hypothetical protein
LLTWHGSADQRVYPEAREEFFGQNSWKVFFEEWILLISVSASTFWDNYFLLALWKQPITTIFFY